MARSLKKGPYVFARLLNKAQGAITGSIAEAYWGVPIEFEDKALTYLLPKLETIYYAFNTIKGKRVKR